jgi:hypothetical protein
MDGPGEQLFAGARLALEQDGDVPCCRLARALDDPCHEATSVQDVGELGRRWDRNAALLPKVDIRDTEQVRQEVCGEVEWNLDGLDTMLLRRLDQLGRESCLREQHPGGPHGRRARAHVEGQMGLDGSVADNPLAGAPGRLKDLGEVGRTCELLPDD